jgi:hypothetical protein
MSNVGARFWPPQMHFLLAALRSRKASNQCSGIIAHH